MSISKPILLIVIGILVVVLFVQTTNLITGFTIQQNRTATTNASAPNANPGLTNVNFSMVATPSAGCANDTSTVWCWGIAIDDNGWRNITSANATLWANEIGAAACDTASEANMSKCYVNTSCFVNTSSNATATTINCSFKNLANYALNGTWNCTMWVNDSIGPSATDNSNDATLTTRARSAYYAININTDIYWGAVTVGSKSQIQDNVTNCGNRPIDIQVNGTNMECDSGTTIGSQNISISVGSAAENFNLTGNLQTLQTNHSIPTQETPLPNETTYWNLSMPRGTTGSCKGNATFVAIEDS
ncbi:MAG: hypothetical protein PHC66_00220 [Candidatus Nanoarchaeia archaeon]|nr:hypothetical protein [Candidatus Nanoarchaeia archaeon]MDD5239626.1 hypothetical protein [Candidatus Nanoarchaeia archaeon]